MGCSKRDSTRADQGICYGCGECTLTAEQKEEIWKAYDDFMSQPKTTRKEKTRKCRD